MKVDSSNNMAGSSSSSSGCSSSSSSSSYFVLLLVVAPLILTVIGFVCFMSPIPASPWVSSVSYSDQQQHPRRSVFRTSSSGNNIPPPTPPLSSTKESDHDHDQKHVDNLMMNTRIMGTGGHHEKLHLRSSSPPQLAKETIQLHQPANEIKQEGSKSSSKNLTSNVVVLEVETTRRVHHKKKEYYSKLQHLETGLARARAAIREASLYGNQTISDPDYVPVGPLYWNSHAFHRSYLEMEKQFKVFIYEEGDPPLFHSGPCKSIYSMEGNFIHEMEMQRQFRTRDPHKAHVYFLPFSIAMMVRFIYEPNSHDITPIKKAVIDYVDVVGSKYPFWNRSLGADHFMLSCHDWGPLTSTYIPHLYKNSIRALCNANTSEGFRPSKDLSIPEINLKTGDIQSWIGGPSPSQRPMLAFFAGGLHGPIRPILLEHWMNKDEEIRVYEYLPKGISYNEMMKKSKYCICPSGYEVASPRIVEALYAGCVPVLISDHYVPPFSDVLNWKSFSVEVPVSEIPNLKKILMGISQRHYIKMQRRGLEVRRHFEVNSPPKRFDVFHMILHSIWLRRLNVQIHDT
ncbi:Exostosin-like [Macleaya cordata]|uniref:Exostosin-like n=1 Tax=Macleaya cordata TaxID=56857 RepID=A0A200R599_MACCD|nr:Exostosin-like [Macleaya cordata]